jgi:hypothetical protein
MKADIIELASWIWVSSEGKILPPENVNQEVVGLLEYADYFLAHRPMQPKSKIADYIELEILKNPEKFKGIKVPKRFTNLQEAIASGKKYIARSEHPQDYDGISGLLDSYVIQAGKSFDEETYIKNLRSWESPMLNEYLRYMEIEIEDFLKDLSFSYWEYVEWRNTIVVQDEVREGRFHLFWAQHGKRGFSHVCDENSTHIFWNSELFSVEEKHALIDAYKKIASSERFDPSQIPNIELQIGNDGEIYFLQYKLGHHEVKDTWELDMSNLAENEIPAQFVRGITPPEWIKIRVSYMGGIRDIILPTETFKRHSSIMNSIKYPHKVSISFWEIQESWTHWLTAFIAQAKFHINICKDDINEDITRFLDTKSFNSDNFEIVAY